LQIAEPLQLVIDELSKLPSIGKKTALRLALHLLKSDKEYVNNLVNSISDLKLKIQFCKKCFNISVDEVCTICSNPKRDQSIICVIEEASDIISIEKTNEFNGLYHVLGGVLSPLSGMNAENLKINELTKRLESGDVKEVLLAVNPDTEGETTSLYLLKILKPYKVKVTRIARGLPIGGDLEFADNATIGRAVTGRIELL
jgi:recombination protein RecR